MLGKFRAAARQARLSEQAVDGHKLSPAAAPEHAYDAAYYFVEDVADPWVEEG